MSQIHNEQTKLLATGLNNVAVAFVVIGGVTPVTALSFGVASAPSLSLGTVAFALIWFCTGLCLHWAARVALRSLRP
ncbi:MULTISPECIES: hypothetical protein [Methylorubrum]|uniref:Amino acid transporter n=1 Tax=Methylorubrum populi TaxID=223967 RepID=A0A833J5H7_9HYPH|nr:hypothetical protein [Methylorubrum populi]KAB7784970.1 hypothetical protein F8B43_3003 [Methylorubrum populi]